MMTKREYFDLLIRSASDGTFPSFSDGACLYRQDMTSVCPVRCAVGVLIPDDMYHFGIEGAGVVQISHTSMIDEHTPVGLGVPDLLDIQLLHDRLARQGWDTEKFVAGIRKMPCFSDCVGVPA